MHQNHLIQLTLAIDFSYIPYKKNEKSQLTTFMIVEVSPSTAREDEPSPLLYTCFHHDSSPRQMLYYAPKTFLGFPTFLNGFLMLEFSPTNKAIPNYLQGDANLSPTYTFRSSRKKTSQYVRAESWTSELLITEF